MIHSPGAMLTGNFGEDAAPTTPDDGAQRSARLPSDYYSAPLSDVRPIVPRWVPWGCGGAAVLALLILFGAGAMLTGSRLGAFLDMVIGMSVSEMKGLYAADVTEAQKTALDAEITTMRDALREGRITVQQVQPFLQELQRVTGDDKVTPAEVDALTSAARGVEELKIEN